MSATDKQHQLQNLDTHIKAVWRRGQCLHATTGTLALLRWMVPLFLVAVAVDWTIDIPASGRLVVLIALLIVSLYKSWQCGWRHLHAFNPTHTALQIEHHHGGFESLLVSAIQLHGSSSIEGSSEALRDETCRLAEEAANSLSPSDAVPFRGLRRPVVIVLLLAGLMGFFAVVGGPFLVAGISRIFAPWRFAQYPTYTQLELADGDLVVKQGASAKIEANLSGIVPRKAKLLLQTGQGRPREMVLDVTEGSCEYTIASASRDFTYQLRAGDARSTWHHVQVVAAPRVEQVKVNLDFPAYLDRASETVEALTLTVPEGTIANWQLTLDQPVSEAVFSRDGEQSLQLQVSDNGRRVKFNATATDSRGYKFSWVDKEHGFDFESPRYYLQVASDKPPRVELTSPLANLMAMPGRAVELAVRVQDDHAISGARVTYRVNRLPEESVALSSPILNGKGEQSIDWDYRTILPDLGVGDTVTFAIEVSDRYPGPQGPHHARSETRRVTFLSKEEYLKQIGRKRDRLLSRVRTIYRQQRAAHVLVRDLDPANVNFVQTCQLEAIRQEMLRSQLNETGDAIQALLDDLAANNVSDASEGDALLQLRVRLQSIAAQHVAHAASLLRDQADTQDDGDSNAPDVSLAARVVNTAARELASLVLLRDIDSAQEVYARESRMLAESQALLRWRTAATDRNHANELSSRQEELAQWTERLVKDLQAGMRYDKRPLAVLRLIRSVKDVQNAATGTRMRKVSELLGQGETDSALQLQADLVRTLLDAEFSVRLSGAYSTMLRTRDALELLTQSQTQLREDCIGLAGNEFKMKHQAIAQQQSELRHQLLTLLLPSIPAPRAKLFDDTFPEAPPVDQLLTAADNAMSEALLQINSGSQEATTNEQSKAEQALITLSGIVSRWSVEMGLRTQGLGTLVAESSERMSHLEEFEANVIDLLEKTDIALAAEKNMHDLVDPQQILAEDLGHYIDDLEEQQDADPDPDSPPLLSRLHQSSELLNAAVESLRQNEAEQAIENQEQAADTLAESYVIAVAQNERLAMLQDLLMFQRAVGFANGYMSDIVAEQRDLLLATEAAEPNDMLKLMPVFDNVRRCMEDVAPLLDLVAGRLDVGTPLAFARTDLEDATNSLKIGDKFDAIDAQDVAAESLEEVQLMVQAVQAQTGYVAEIVELLHRSTSDASSIQYEQQRLMQTLAAGDPKRVPQLIEDQGALIVRAENYGQILTTTTGIPEFADVAEEMRVVLEQLKTADSVSATEQMELVAMLLAENAESLLNIIRMLHGLPSVEVTIQTESELVRLVDVLELASDHRSLFRRTNVADVDGMPAVAESQKDLATRCEEIIQSGETHPLLADVSRHLAEATSRLASSDRNEIRQSQKAADTKLRHFIVEQALALDTAIKYSPSDGDPGEDGEGSDSESALTAGFISDFVSGEAPKDQRTEWKVLGERNRAALNQNFARELPLEYRGLLKNYYERLSK